MIPPFLIKSKPGSENPTRSAADGEHISVPSPCGTRMVNETGIGVEVSASGSMLRSIFPKWCAHFIKHLPVDQGKGKMPVFLFVDGHTSRWSYEGLTLLKENNVYVICLPSHSTIFSQPNDAGVNASFKAVFGQIVRL